VLTILFSPKIALFQKNKIEQKNFFKISTKIATFIKNPHALITPRRFLIYVQSIAKTQKILDISKFFLYDFIMRNTSESPMAKEICKIPNLRRG